MHAQRLGMAFFVAQLALNIHATEIDSFTDRDPLLRDATAELNRMMNERLDEARSRANIQVGCSQEALKRALLDLMGGDWWSTIENDIEANPAIDQRKSSLENSIYRDVTFTEGFALYLAKLGALMRIGPYYIGTDKIGHFFQDGYYFFEAQHTEGKRFEEALKDSQFSEKTYYGRMTTGVYSYGDLSANYDGLLFWERITNTHLPSETAPYFLCVNEQWEQIVAFDIRDYANAAWDEGMNCNSYKDEDMTLKVKARIAELEQERGQSLQCPIVPSECKTMIERYGNVASRVITPLCFESLL